LKRDEAVEEKLSYDEMRKKLNESLKRAFRPEFINRVDNVIIFRALNREDIQKIVKLELAKVAARLVEHNITLSATPEALSLFAEQGYDAEMGARPLRRVIQMRVEDKLSDSLLAGTFVDGDKIEVGVDAEGEVELRRLATEPESEPQPAV